MSKIQLFLISLVGAAPAGFLTYLLCMYLIDQPSGANSMVMIISILTVLCTAPMALLPFLILGMYYSNYDSPRIPKAPKKKPAVDDAEDDATADDDVVADDDVEEEDTKKSKSKKKKKDEDEDEEFETLNEDE